MTPPAGHPIGIPEIAGPDDDALRAVAEAHGLDLIVLFGSTAKRRRRAGSDLDVAIRFAGARDRRPTWEEEAAVEGALFDLLRPRCELDVVLLNGASPLLKWNVARDGVPLFCALPVTWTLFQIQARKEFEDTAKYRRLRWQVLMRRLGYEPAGR